MNMGSNVRKKKKVKTKPGKVNQKGCGEGQLGVRAFQGKKRQNWVIFRANPGGGTPTRSKRTGESGRG